MYTVNLSKVLISPDNRRSKRAVSMIKEFAQRHMKTENVKIDEELNYRIWSRGIRSPPRKVKVKMTKDEDGNVIVSPYEEKATKTAETTKEKSSSTTTTVSSQSSTATTTTNTAEAAETAGKATTPQADTTEKQQEARNQKKD